MVQIKNCLLKNAELMNRLLVIWYQSVCATHDFLSAENIESLIPFVKGALKEIPILMIAKEEDTEVGFIGVSDLKIEMLFLLPEYAGKGIGRKLVQSAMKQHSVSFVDVNEQNQKAKGFYEHLGFEVYECNELDEQGNPFPILKMKLV